MTACQQPMPADSMTYEDIEKATTIPVADLKRALQSLACAKFKVLNKEPKGREVEDSDSFSFNADFTCKQLRFKVATVSAQKETETEKQETREKVRTAPLPVRARLFLAPPLPVCSSGLPGSAATTRHLHLPCAGGRRP